MEIHTGIQIRDLVLFIPLEKTVIFSDFHMGYEEAILKGGVLLPRHQLPDTLTRVKKILEGITVETIIVTGDLKHEFGTISGSEWKQSFALLDLFAQYASKVLLIKGNHDSVLGPIARKKNVEIVPYVLLNDIFICHGDVIPNNLDFEKAKTLIIGHEHPAITLHDTTKKEHYKCFLKGAYKKKTLLVLPSFNLVTTGTNILKEHLLSPFLQQDLKHFTVYIVEKDRIYNFGKIKDLM